MSFLAACGGGGDDGSTVTPASGTGTLRVALTDAPACGFDHVYVTVERVRVHQTSSANDNDAGWSEIVLNPTQRIDLLGLTNGVLAELGQTPLGAGQYQQVRLVLSPNRGGTPANSVVPTGGIETALDTPSATPKRVEAESWLYGAAERADRSGARLRRLPLGGTQRRRFQSEAGNRSDSRARPRRSLAPSTRRSRE